MKKLLAIALILSAAACSKHENQNTIATYQVNDGVSKAEWKGSAPDHFHVGSFKVTGSLTAGSNGTVTGGDFVIPIASLEDYDLQEPVKKQLLDDLLSPNFFNLVLYPEAKFHINKVESYTATDTSAVEGANYLLSGDFSMTGQTHLLSFPIKVTKSGDSLFTEAKFQLDRTKWGMTIYSDPTAQLYILPKVNIHLNIHAASK